MCFARLTPCQLANESNRFQLPPSLVVKLPVGSGVFSWSSAKSAAAKRCCRSLLPKTYTGSFPRVAVSEKPKWGISKERASRTPADAAFVSAIAALRSGFFSSANVDRLLQGECRSLGFLLSRSCHQG